MIMIMMKLLNDDDNVLMQYEICQCDADCEYADSASSNLQRLPAMGGDQRPERAPERFSEYRYGMTTVLVDYS